MSWLITVASRCVWRPTLLLVNRALQKHELADNGCEPLRLATDFITVLRGQSQMYCLLHPDFIPDQNIIAEWVSEAVDILLNQVSLP